MKEFKYISILAVCATVLILFSQVQDCQAQQFTEQTVVVPADSNFMPVKKQKYTPPSLPFDTKKSGFKLPSNVKERDVARVVSVQLKPGVVHGSTSLTMTGPTIDVITTLDGETFVAKDSSLIESVTETTFEPPIARTVLKFGVGGSFDFAQDDGRLSLSPSVVFAPQEWHGWIHVPVLMADLYGAGVGGQFKLYHDFYLGAVYHYSWSAEKSVKATLHFVF